MSSQAKMPSHGNCVSELSPSWGSIVPAGSLPVSVREIVQGLAPYVWPSEVTVSERLGIPSVIGLCQIQLNRLKLPVPSLIEPTGLWE